jgi:ABC-type transporter Mla MlaB component
MDSARPTTIVLAIAGPLGRDELPSLCRRVHRLLAATGAQLAVCDVSRLSADAVAVDALARIALTASRLGSRVCLRSPADNLRDMVALAGLQSALPVEPRRQPEQGKQAVGVQEERELPDALI